MKNIRLVGVLVVMIFVGLVCDGQVITTVAGNGYASFGGDDGPATAARLFGPDGLALDKRGNLFIVDQQNFRIRKVSSTGIITEVAGNGLEGTSGDGGQATDAELGGYIHIAVDTAGNLLISDGQSKIRKINSSGIIYTMAGTTGVGFGGDGGPATAASFHNPYGIAVDKSNNVYIADALNERIRKINAAGIVSTIAGTGYRDSIGHGGFSGDGGYATDAELYWPMEVAFDYAGNIYFTDGGNGRVRKIDTAGIISTIGGGGSLYARSGESATSVLLFNVACLAVDSSGNVFMSNYYGVNEIDTSGYIINIVSGYGFGGDGGLASAALVAQPTSLVCDRNGNLYISDRLNNRVRRIDTSGIINTVAGGGLSGFGDGGAATAAELYFPSGIALDTIGNLFVADWGNNRIRKINNAGIITTIAGTNYSGFSGDGGAATAAELKNPRGVAIDKNGNIFIADSDNGRIRKINTSGIISTVGGATGAYLYEDGAAATDVEIGIPFLICVDRIGNIYFSDYARVLKIDTSGIINTYAGGDSIGFSGDGGPATDARFNYYINGLAVDGVGNLYIADSYNNRIRKVDASGYISTFAGTGSATGHTGDGGAATDAELNGPSDVAVDLLGNVFIADFYNSCIREVTTDGIIHTIAGNDTAGFRGDGGPATMAEMTPSNVVVDAHLNKFLIDANRIRKISAGHVPAITISSAICVGVTSTLTDSVSGGIWSISNPSVATITPSTGIITGINAGAAMVYYNTINGVASRSITVTALPVAAAISGSTTICETTAAALSDTSVGGTWSSSSTSIATVGSTGIVTGVGTGIDTIKYSVTNSCGTAVAAHAITINPLPHARAITGVSSVCAGSAITLTDTASGGSWSSSGTGIATVSSTGVVSAVAAGSVTITYSVTNSCGTATAEHNVTVNPLAVAGTLHGAGTICEDSSVTLTVSSGAAGGTWTTSSAAVATVNSAGVVRGLTGGSATITYTVTNGCGSEYTTMGISVTPRPTVAAITGASSICPGLTETLRDGTAGGVWTSSSTAVATISSTGVVTAVGGGTSTISYTLTNSCGSTSATALVVVDPTPIVDSISGPSSVCSGSSLALTDASAGGTWSSTNTAIATVSASGLVYGVAAGVDTIKYTLAYYCGLAIASHLVTITPAAYAGTISGLDSICPGDTTTLFSTVPTGTWSSSNTAAATISSLGLVTGIATGTTNIVYAVTNSCGTVNAVYPFEVRSIYTCPEGIAYVNRASDLLTIFPNPNSGFFTLQLTSATTEEATLRITNLTGQVVKELKMMTNKPLDIELAQPAGVYLVSVASAGGKWMEKVVVE